MDVPRKIVALAFGGLFAVSVATLVQRSTQAQAPAAPRAGGETLVVSAAFEWIEKSEVAALIDGNVEKMELEIGKTVKKGGVIGYLHGKKAELAVKKAATAASSTGAIEKADAQKQQAATVVARNRRLIKQNTSYVSKEDQEKAEADLLVTVAMIKEAEENRALAQDELALAQNALDEHTVRAPFSGVVIRRLKNPGESVRANEPVVELGNLDKLRVYAYIPLEYVYRVAEGTVVEIQPKIEGTRGGLLPVEQKKFRGVISFVDPQVQPVAETAVRIYADFTNESHELLPGLKGTLTIFLNPPGAAPARAAQAPAPAVEAAPAAAVGGIDLPQLPR